MFVYLRWVYPHQTHGIQVFITQPFLVLPIHDSCDTANGYTQIICAPWKSKDQLNKWNGFSFAECFWDDVDSTIPRSLYI